MKYNIFDDFDRHSNKKYLMKKILMKQNLVKKIK